MRELPVSPRSSAAPAGGSAPEIALGTVQFGMAYGITGAAKVPACDVRSILAAAHECGVRMIDTAPGYGDIEERLVGLFPPGAAFSITSKIAALPKEYLQAHSDAKSVAQHIEEQILRSAQHLRGFLQTMLFHRAEDLESPMGEVIWQAAAATARRLGVRLGVSIYDVHRLPPCCVGTGLDAIQCPANVFDQRLLDSDLAARTEVHARSIFLQGLLLMDRATAASRLPAAATALSRWERWCHERNLSPLAASLGFAKSLPVRFCVLGVDSPEHFSEVAAAWSAAAALPAAELAVNALSVIDPREWPRRPS